MPWKDKTVRVVEIIFQDGTKQTTAGIISNPPNTKKKVVNIYQDPEIGAQGKYVMEREE